ncbi:MAG: hypothetical protein LBQ97_08470 [Fusobacteriaceae bacterium]|jgi:hypothetical protein|nr:hypothetical protein [Fusobacteriaceae bacterium]
MGDKGYTFEELLNEFVDPKDHEEIKKEAARIDRVIQKRNAREMAKMENIDISTYIAPVKKRTTMLPQEARVEGK